MHLNGDTAAVVVNGNGVLLDINVDLDGVHARVIDLNSASVLVATTL